MILRRLVTFLLLGFCIQPVFSQEKKQFIVLDPGVELYLFPEKKSEVLKRLPFGEILSSENQKEADSKFQLLTDRDGLTGWVDSRSLFKMGSKGSYPVITKAIEKLLYQDSGPNELESVFTYLTKIEEGPIFQGNEYLFLKVRRLVVLQRYLEVLQSPEYRSKSRQKLEDVLKNNPSEVGVYSKTGIWSENLTNSPEGSKLKVRPESFWKIAEAYPDSKPGDFSAYLAVKYTPEVRCGKDPICVLQDEENRRLKYLLLQPNGNYAPIFSTHLEKRLLSFSKDRETLVCDTKLQKEPQLKSFRSKVQELPARYGKKFYSKLRVIEEECLKK
ncbi:SH3 domain-containing protein [Leptospira sarikeiensis]|uniref:SH3 domain-containing protein n=1 Tax=Leptospira sarikeiensis TaxID=2484943 RepID=A0A4V3JRD5_9LEPT|nr:SH3 domain-containing protein [Leptospira sarikeiensis]TGL59585.1 SH3 domain-containing protein [Leptospira sarikeiensis]